MAEAKVISFNHREVTESLIKQANIREGKWQLLVEFSIIGANVPWPPMPVPSPMSPPPTNQGLVPAAIIPIVRMGLQRVEQDTPMSVDASIINPPPSR